MVWLDQVGDEPADEVEIEAWVDRNGDGRIAAEETSRGQTDNNGSFSLAVPAETGRATTVSFARNGYARQLRTVQAVQDTTPSLTIVLYRSESLDCEGGVCQDAAGSVRVSGIEAKSGRARVFNPVTEVDAFPGAFADNQGNLLISSVFASFDLRDEDDREIRELPAGKKARIEMALPRDTFSTISDLVPGNGRIDVPMYSFDEVSGQWRADGTGWLESADGNPLSEGDVSQLRDGSLASQAYVVAEVSHFSYWNCDWPQSEKTVVIVRPVDPEDPQQQKPLKLATCFLRGVNFAGVSPPYASGTGVECIEARRSENPGEDLDGNGVAGETFRAQVVCVWKDKYYRFPEFDLPAQSGSCPDGGLDLGPLVLDAEHEVAITACTVHGTVLENGVPVANVPVIAEDPTVPEEVGNSVCGGTCMNAGISGSDGTFTVTVAFGDSFSLSAPMTRTEGAVTLFFEGKQKLFHCPASPVRLHLALSACSANLPAVQADKSSGQIDWQPPIPAGLVTVIGLASASLKWQIFSENGFAPPIQYGTLPAGAMQISPASGSPSPLASGDQIVVSPRGGYLTVGGYRCPSTGMTLVP
jgi:hypothetical protein